MIEGAYKKVRQVAVQWIKHLMIDIHSSHQLVDLDTRGYEYEIF